MMKWPSAVDVVARDADARTEVLVIRCNVWVIQRGENLGFTAEPREALRVVGDGGEDHLNRHVPIKRGVMRPIDGAHAAGTEGGDDFVRAKARAGGNGHLRPEL